MKTAFLLFYLLQAALACSCHGLTIELDFSYETAATNFFGTTPQAKAAVQAAASDLSEALGTKLDPVATRIFQRTVGITTATFTWNLTFPNPTNGGTVTLPTAALPTFPFPADTVRIYVGMQKLGISSTELGRGGPGGAQVNLIGGGQSSEWIAAVQGASAAANSAMDRGAGPLIGTLAGDSTLGSVKATYSMGFGMTVGSIWFNHDTDDDKVIDSPATMAAYWHFDHTTPVAPGKADFYSVALHEILHALGLGSSQTWGSSRSGTTWNGALAKALNAGSGTGLISADFGHLASGLMSTRLLDGAPQEVAMDPSLFKGTRKYLTAMDLAFLRDLGYRIGGTPAPVSGSAAVLSNCVASISGTATLNGSSTVVSLEYGLTTAYGDHISLPALNPIPGSSAPVAVTLLLTDLTPGQTYHYRLTATNSAGSAKGSDAVFKTPALLVGPSLVCDGQPASFSPFDGGQFPGRKISAFTQGLYGTVSLDGNRIVYSPAPNYFGVDTFEYTLVSSAVVPLPTDVPFKVGTTVGVSGTPAPKPLAVKGGGVPGKPGATFNAFGVPAAGTFSGELLLGGGAKQRSIFLADGSLRLGVGGGVPGAEGTIAKLGEPCGQAVLASLKIAPPVTAKTDAVLLAGLNAAPGSGPLRVAAREGADLSQSGLPGVSIKSFGAFDGNGSALFFQATLQGAGVSAKNDGALFAALPDGSLRVLVRELEAIAGRTVATIGSLVGVAGSLADGRWRSGESAIGVRLSFSDKSQALYRIPATAASAADFTLLARSGQTLSGAPLAGAQIAAFGLPGFGSGGAAFVATLKTGAASVTAANDGALFFCDNTGAEPQLLARESAPAPGADGLGLGALFKSFGAPVAGAQKRVAFPGVLAGAGVGAANSAGIWWRADSGGLRLLARAGSPAPGAQGGRFAKFLSLAMDDGPQGGPVFLASLLSEKAVPIDAKNNLGLWAVNSAGILQKVLQSGQSVQVNGASRTIGKFVALAGAPGSLGAARGYDGARHLAVLATFLEDRSSALLEIVVP